MVGVPDPIDVIVGSNLKAARTRFGLSQTKLGEALGITFQQIQKYEQGRNRVSASKLVRISEILNLDVTNLFHGTGQGERIAVNFEISPQALKVARSYEALKSARVRKAIMVLLSPSETGDDEPFDEV